MLGPAGEMNAIPGEAGVDYPVYNTGIIIIMIMMLILMMIIITIIIIIFSAKSSTRRRIIDHRPYHISYWLLGRI